MSIGDILLIIIKFAGAVVVFIYGMKLMSEGLQKFAGNKMRSIMGQMTNSPLRGIITGAGVTAAIQSSTATTVMVVSFVNSGLLTLAGAIAVIMGANIGTTITSWIILLGLECSVCHRPAAHIVQKRQDKVYQRIYYWFRYLDGGASVSTGCDAGPLPEPHRI